MRCNPRCSGCDKPSPGPSAWAVILRSRAGPARCRKAKKVWPSGHRTSGTKSARISPARGMEGVSCPFSFLHILLLGSIGGVGFFHNPLGFLLYQERRSFVPAQVPDGLTSLSPLSVPPGPAPLTANRLFQPYHTLPLPCSSYLSTHKNMQKRPPEWEVFFCFIPGSIAQRGSAIWPRRLAATKNNTSQRLRTASDPCGRAHSYRDCRRNARCGPSCPAPVRRER